MHRQATDLLIHLHKCIFNSKGHYQNQNFIMKTVVTIRETCESMINVYTDKPFYFIINTFIFISKERYQN